MDGKLRVRDLILVLAVLGAIWFLVETLLIDSGVVPDPKLEAGAAPMQDAPEVSDAPLPAAPVGSPSPVPQPPAHPGPKADASRADPAAPAATKRTPPESLRLEDVRWDDVSGEEAVTDLVARTGLPLRMSENVRQRLRKARVTMHVQGEMASHVLARILQPHELGYSARKHEVHIFLDDD